MSKGTILQDKLCYCVSIKQCPFTPMQGSINIMLKLANKDKQNIQRVQEGSTMSLEPLFVCLH